MNKRLLPITLVLVCGACSHPAPRPAPRPADPPIAGGDLGRDGGKIVRLDDAIEVNQGDPEPDYAPDYRLIQSQGNGRIRRCYEQQLKSDAALSGKLRITLTIDPSGAVSEIHGDGGNLPQPMIDCITQVLQGLRFDTRAAPVTLEVPLVFAAPQ